MSPFSFDIVSEVDFQEVDNAVNQARKELAQRYDFKGSPASIDYNRDEKTILLIAEDDYRLRSLREILLGRMIKRSIASKSLNFQIPENASAGTLRQKIVITSGLPAEKTKELNKIIKETKIKVQTQVEGSKVRVFSPKKDDLQAIISHLKNLDFSLPLQFTNYR